MAMTTRIGAALLEKDIQKACISWLNTVPGVKVWRQNRGAMFGEHKGKKWAVRFGTPGAADITGIGPHGRRIEIEVKRPGKVPTEEQEAFLDEIREFGGIAFWCTSVEACCSSLKEYFALFMIDWHKSWEV